MPSLLRREHIKHGRKRERKGVGSETERDKEKGREEVQLREDGEEEVTA